MMMLKIPEVGGSLLFYFCENKNKKNKIDQNEGNDCFFYALTYI